MLGDGTEVIPDQHDEELFDQADDHELSNQAQPASGREDTPGPQAKQETSQISESPASTDDKDKSQTS